jgi:DNA-binding LytR/AlgR family response regulator
VEFASDVLLIADDSSLRKTVSFILSDYLKSPVPIVSGTTALHEVIRSRPRIVFIQDDLRGSDGIRLGEEILTARQSTVVLIARNQARAVDAYAAGIPDFLLTPLNRERLLAALSRGLQRTSPPRGSWRTEHAAPSRPPMRFKSKRGFIFLRPAEIVWISAAANYLDIHTADANHRVRGTLAETCERLKEYRQFLRIHRSIVINADYMRRLRSTGIGEWAVVLNDLRELPVSRRHVLDEWISSTRSMPSEFAVADERELPKDHLDRLEGRQAPHELRRVLPRVLFRAC